MMTDLESTIHKAVLTVAQDKNPAIVTVAPTQALVEDLGLKSLDLARLVAILDLDLGVEPFAGRVPITSIRTVSDLHRAYALCLNEESDLPPVPGEPAPPRTAQRGQNSQAHQRALREAARRSLS